jgi:hypothetical protein
MKTEIVSAAWLLSALLLSTCLVEADVVAIEISRREVDPLHSLQSRYNAKRATISETLDNRIQLYQANISVGTPPQRFTVQIDTGSSDTYLMASTAPTCVQKKCTGGTCKYHYLVSPISVLI